METENDNFVHDKDELKSVINEKVQKMNKMLFDLEKSVREKSSLWFVIANVQINLDIIAANNLEDDDVMTDIKNLGKSIDVLSHCILGKIQQLDKDAKNMGKVSLRKCIIRLKQNKLKKLAEKVDKIDCTYQVLIGSVEIIKGIDQAENEA